MSLLIALDPNILLAATEGHSDSIFVLRKLIRNRDEYSLGIGPKLEIYKAFKQYRLNFIGNEFAESFIKLFLDEGQKRITLLREATLDQEQHGWLVESYCGDPVEAELIAVGIAAAQDKCMLVLRGEYGSKTLAYRCTDDPEKVNQLHWKFKTLQIWPVSLFDQKLAQIHRSRYPGNEAQLREYIKNGEDEHLEFKQPKDIQINPRTINFALKAACAMVNTGGGLVVVGVKDDGEIIGVDADKDQNGQIDIDRLSRRFSDLFNRFYPSVNQFVKPAVIRLSNGRCAVLLHVEKGDKKQRYYYDTGRVRAVFDRCGCSDRIDKTTAGPSQLNWHS